MTGTYGAKNIRNLSQQDIGLLRKSVLRKDFYFILENLYDTYNIGALFRLADAVGVKKVYLCGDMETPPNPKISRSAIGTERIIDWEKSADTREAIMRLRETHKDLRIIAVEKNSNAKNYTEVAYSLPVALVFGSESFGISRLTLDMVDSIVEIPMYGINKSLNVIVAAGIVSYWILGHS